MTIHDQPRGTDRCYEAGCSIKIAKTDHQSMGIDTPEDLDRDGLYLKANYSQD